MRSGKSSKGRHLHTGNLLSKAVGLFSICKNLASLLIKHQKEQVCIMDERKKGRTSRFCEPATWDTSLFYKKDALLTKWNLFGNLFNGKRKEFTCRKYS